MAGVVLLVNILIILFCNPWIENQSSDNLKTESQIVSKMVNLVFNSSQLLLQWRDEKEFDLFMGSCRDDHDRVMQIPKFYRDVETRFSYLESESTCVHDRFQRASRMIVNEKVCNAMNVGIQTLRHNWTKEHSFISRFDADVLNGKRNISEQGIHVQLTMAKGFVDRELLKIRKNMSEDNLSLEEVNKDVSLLQKYFGK